MFYWSKFRALDLSSFDTRNVTNMQRMFGSCLNLTSVKLSSFNTEKVRDMSYMFICCLKLPSLDLSSFDTRNVTNMELMFEMDYDLDPQKSALATIYASDKFVTKNLPAGKKIFNKCQKLKGGKGTSYSDSASNDASYARIDGGTSAPGYFTAKKN
ncbi:MAG: BspA family leucine-rich repeat surface protein, partial [Treponema sp.]|nr:BspA family leucine-rich repeat surface protein [Treponema sp.]